MQVCTVVRVLNATQANIPSLFLICEDMTNKQKKRDHIDKLILLFLSSPSDFASVINHNDVCSSLHRQ